MLTEIDNTMPPELHLCNAVALLWKAKNHLSFVNQKLAADADELCDRAIRHANELLPKQDKANAG